MDINKRCSKCGDYKPLDKFNVDKNHKDGRRSECKVCQSAKIKEWNDNHKEWNKERDALYHRGHYNKNKRAEYHKRWYQENKVRIRAQYKEYQVQHREQAATRTARYRNNKRSLEATLTNEQWELLKSIFGGRCAYCGKRTRRLEREHIIPVSLGGALSLNNIVPACRSCNAKKGVNRPIAPINLVLI